MIFITSKAAGRRQAGIFELLPLSRRLLLIVWPFLAIVILLVWLITESLVILGSTRSYSEGESLWSKGQKQAVFHLMLYAQTHDPTHFRAYQEAMSVPLAYKRFRIEMQKANPDYKVVYQALSEGRTHPDDMQPGIKFFRRFQRVSPMAEVIKLWETGDEMIGDLTRAADELHRYISAGQVAPRQLQPLLDRILEINSRLTPMEDAFNKSLGDASRQAQRLLLSLIFGTATLLLPIGIYLSNRTLKHSANFERALKLSEERFDLAVAGSNDGLWDWDILTGEWYYSPRFKQLLGYAEDEMESSLTALLSLLHPDQHAAFGSALQSHLTEKTVFDVEIQLRLKSDVYGWFRCRGQSVRAQDGRAIRMAGALTDITDRKLAAAELFAEKERALVTLASIADGVITTDTEGWINYMNPVAQDLTGWKLDKAYGLPIQALFRLVDELHQRSVPNPIEMVLREERTIEVATNMLLKRNDGATIPVVHSAAPIRDRAGQLIGVVLVLHDVSRERQYAAKLSYQASHDSLTGLINRSEFERRVNIALQSAAQIGRHHAVMYLDLDQFKVVNDTCGHAAGDQLMRQISALLAQCLREGDTLARLGGDEFGVLLENCPPTAALRIADKLRQTVTDFHFAWEHLSFSIGVSIGLVNVEDGLFTLAEILRAADAACYMAKEKGRNRVQVYRPDDSELTLRQGEMEWIGRLQKALDENRFVLYAQDIVGVGEKRTQGVHCELLIRMLDERGELVPPMAFIPAAERYNLMPAIDRWVIRTAFATLARLKHDRDAEPIALCAINLSGASIGDERFLDFVRDQLRVFDIERSCVCFEITETAAIANLDKAARFIQELKTLGCRFCLDDFGAGMSSFGYLKHLPVDFLKIDGVFVKDMADDPIDRAMVEAINSIGHVMGKQTIAEFVDNERILVALEELGVDFAQGYGIDKPKLFAPRLRVAERIA